ncbi:MAG TPA: hypothetical protein VJ570_08000 [Holophagaceae bacterium]|nr:hypothetical protein [Holophagaceae bacterium]
MEPEGEVTGMELLYSHLGTFSGTAQLLLALGISLGLRPWPAHPWIRPWMASYWISAFTLLALSMPLVWSAIPLTPLKAPTFPLLNSGFFLSGGLQALGWLRMRRARLPLVLALVPVGLYLALFHLLGGAQEARVRVLLFSSMETLLFGLTAAWARQGLLRVSPRLARVIPAVLAFHAAFYFVRTGLALFFPSADDYLLSVAVAMMEGLVFNLALAYLQVVVMMEEEGA